MTIDADLLVAAVGCSRALAERYAAPLTDACRFYEINTPARLAAFLAQIGHESGSFRFTREIASGQAYEGRKDLGNTEPGDGPRFRGRGLIQTTGRANYARLVRRLRERGVDCPDFVAEPERLEEPWWAALSAADYWDMRGLNELADVGDFDQITKRINGGVNGKADRDRRWERAKQALATEEGKEDMAPFIAAALPALLNAVPKLAEVFSGAQEDRKEKIAALAVDVARDALGAPNAQAVAEALESDPEAPAKVEEAIRERWFDIVEGGGGGIDGARKADVAFQKSGASVWKSPSFIVALCLLPIVYMIVGAVTGLWGSPFTDDVRAAVANGLVGLIVGALAGYYYGGVTSRNRT